MRDIRAQFPKSGSHLFFYTSSSNLKFETTVGKMRFKVIGMFFLYKCDLLIDIRGHSQITLARFWHFDNLPLL